MQGAGLLVIWDFVGLTSPQRTDLLHTIPDLLIKTYLMHEDAITPSIHLSLHLRIQHGAVTAQQQQPQRQHQHLQTRSPYNGRTCILTTLSSLHLTSGLQFDLRSRSRHHLPHLPSNPLRSVLRPPGIFPKPSVDKTIQEEHERDDGIWYNRGGVRGAAYCCSEKGTWVESPVVCLCLCSICKTPILDQCPHVEWDGDCFPCGSSAGASRCGSRNNTGYRPAI